MRAEALAQVGAEAVIDRAAVGVVGVHVAEGDASGEGRRGSQLALKPGMLPASRDRLRDAAEPDRPMTRKRRGSKDSGRRDGRSSSARHRRRGTAESVTRRGLHPLTVNGLAGAGQIAGLLPNACIVVGRVEVGNHQVAANCVGIDRTVQMASAIEVVGEAERESLAEIALDGDVRLLRVGVDEILGLRIAEGLEAQRQERGRSRFR